MVVRREFEQLGRQQAARHRRRERAEDEVVWVEAAADLDAGGCAAAPVICSTAVPAWISPPSARILSSSASIRVW